MMLPSTDTLIWLAMATGALLLLSVGVTIPWMLVQSQRRIAQRIGEAEADAARRAVADQRRLEVMSSAFEEKLSDLAVALNSLQIQTADTPAIHDDTRKALIKLKQIADGLGTLRGDVVRVNDEITNQSAAKFQANEIIRAALERGGPGSA
jgi:hypothetical protein